MARFITELVASGAAKKALKIANGIFLVLFSVSALYPGMLVSAFVAVVACATLLAAGSPRGPAGEWAFRLNIFGLMCFGGVALLIIFTRPMGNTWRDQAALLFALPHAVPFAFNVPALLMLRSSR